MSAIFGDDYATIYLRTGLVTTHTIILPVFGTNPSYASGSTICNHSILENEAYPDVDKSGNNTRRSLPINGELPQVIGKVGFRYEVDITVYITDADSGIEDQIMDVFDWTDLAAASPLTVWIKPHNDINAYYKVQVMNHFALKRNPSVSYLQYQIELKLMSEVYDTRLGESALPT